MQNISCKKIQTMKEKLMAILSDFFETKESELKMDFNKENISNWDSLRQMDLVVSIENEFNIVLDIADIVKMNSIREIFEVVESKLTN